MSWELLRPGYLADTAFCLDITRLAGISFLPAHFYCGLKMLHLSILSYPLAYCITIEKKITLPFACHPVHAITCGPSCTMRSQPVVLLRYCAYRFVTTAPFRGWFKICFLFFFSFLSCSLEGGKHSLGLAGCPSRFLLWPVKLAHNATQGKMRCRRA